MRILPRRIPATLIGLCVAAIVFAAPFVFNIDLVQLDIKFFELLHKDHLDDLFVGLILIFIGVVIDRATAFKDAAEAIRELNKDLEEAVLQFVETMAQALDARDKYTAGHSNRVSVNSTALAAAMGLTPKEVEIIRIGSKLHDIGKIGIPDSVLQKPGKLTDEEYALVKLHPQIGRKILEKVQRFEDYLPIVELHHENHDGGGYPYGLKGQDVPLGVRIVHVADVFDAITSNRAYRKAMSRADMLAIMTEGAGKQFDPSILAVFLDSLDAGKLVQAALDEVGAGGLTSSETKAVTIVESPAK